ncbi:unnamed protein product [Phytophthora fragariaefolia]|uniref:Unnamed protein product n=1 Tax=Phytophthora fragariaefolia TaxID=1490495 RepID=A0A9W7D323_9STRA|nr:unnamed protein product [Phytophthora fragariaefolia]
MSNGVNNFDGADWRPHGAASDGGDGANGTDRRPAAGDGDCCTDGRLQGTASDGGDGANGADWRQHDAAAGGGGSPDWRPQRPAANDRDGSDGIAVENNTAAGGGGGKNIVSVVLPSVVSGDDDNGTDRSLTVAAHRGSGDSVQNGYVALLCSTASTGGVGGEGSELPAACDDADAAYSSAPKRKRGRPKGSKDKPKAPDAAGPKRKRGRPAGSKASPKRSLTQAMGRAHADTPTDTQTTERSPQREASAAASTPSNESDADVPMQPGSVVPSAAPDGRPPRTSPARPPLIPALYVDTLVAFSPEKEGWTKRQKTKDKYVGVGSSYLVGRDCRIVKGALFHVQWLDSQYQNKDEHLNLSMIQRGNANYRSLHGTSSRVGWSHLCAADEEDCTQIEGDIDDVEECMEMFDPPWNCQLRCRRLKP